MSGLHGTGSSPAQHEEALLGQPFAQQDNIGKHRVGTLQGMSAHDSHTQAAVVFLKESIECHVDAVVVERTGQRLPHIAGILAHLQVVLVNPAVVAIRQRSALIAFAVEVGSSIEAVTRHVVGNCLQPFGHALNFLDVIVSNHSNVFAKIIKKTISERISK